MNNFDFNSKKYLILLVIICIVFAILIIKAFDYLPDTDNVDTADVEIENINSSADINTTVKKPASEAKSKPIQKSGVLYRSADSISQDTNIDEIDAPYGVGEEVFPEDNISDNSNEKVSPDVLALKAILNGKKYADAGNFPAANDQYKKALELSSDKEINAQANEGIAILYARSKKFSTALSFANKAYELSPSSDRELLIVKIFYNAGKTEAASARLNQMVKNGFNKY